MSLDGRRVVWMSVATEQGDILVVIEMSLVESPPVAGRPINLARPEEMGGNVSGVITNVIWRDYR